MKEVKAKNVWNKLFAGKISAKMMLYAALFMTMFILNVAVALAQAQYHPLSQVYPMDKTIDLETYQLNASRVNASYMNVQYSFNTPQIRDSTDVSRITMLGGGDMYIKDSVGGIAIAIDADSDVGVGSLLPQAKLHISSTSPKSTFLLGNSNQPDLEWLFNVTGISDLDIRSEGSSENLMHFDVNDQKIGIGMDTPTALLHVDGDINVTSGNDVCIDSGNCLSSVGVSGWTDGGANVYLTTAGDNVGIGTSTPADKLTVVGTLNATNIQLATNCIDGQILKWSGGVGTCGTDDTLGGGAVTGGGASGRLSIWNGTSSVNSSSNLAWDFANERLGIGTPSPGAKLDVHVSSGGAATLGDSLVTARGNYAVAMGSSSDADGLASVAMGYATNASGNYAVAIGDSTNASGSSSFSSGENTKASGSYSVAMGRRTIATGMESFALGWGIEAGGYNSVAIALNDQSGTNVSQPNTMAIMGGNVGIGTTTPRLSLDVVDGLMVHGPNSANSGEIYLGPGGSNNNYGLIDYNGSLFRISDMVDSGSFFSGTVRLVIDSNTGNVGIGTINPGAKLDVVTSSGGSASFGDSTNSITGDYSVGVGTGNTVSDESSLAVGRNNNVDSVYSMALGDDNNVTDNAWASFAGGYNSYAANAYAFAFGDNNSVTGEGGVAFGKDNYVTSVYGTAIGYDNTVTANYAFAGGYLSRANGSTSVAFGNEAIASGAESVAIGGNYPRAYGIDSAVIGGYQNEVHGAYSFSAGGYENEAWGNYAYAFGRRMNVSGEGSVGFDLRGSSGVSYAQLSQDNTFAITGGKVGIGTTSPDQALKVDGNVNVTGDLVVDWTTFFVDSNNNRVGVGTTTPGAKLDVSSGSGGAAKIGSSLTSATGDYAMAVGVGANASGYSSIAFGGGETVGRFAMAVGEIAAASGNHSIALGRQTQASGNYALATGSVTYATANYSTAMGRQMLVSGVNSFGIGLDSTFAQVSQSNTMAIMGGKVGINVTNPSELLELNGSILLSEGNGVQKVYVQRGLPEQDGDDLMVYAGSGGNTASTDGNAGGDAYVAGGNGSAGGVGGTTGGDGGDIHINAGKGGGLSAAAGSGGDGGDVRIDAGDAGASPSTGANGGNLVLDTGIATGTGNNGTITMNIAGKNAMVIDTDRNVQVAGNITPSVNDTYTLGTPDLVWQEVYVGPASLHVGNDTISNLNGQLTWGGSQLSGLWEFDKQGIGTLAHVGIGGLAISQVELYVIGDASKTLGGTAWSSPSDVRLKNILESGDEIDGLALIESLTPIMFVWNDVYKDAFGENDAMMYGFSAQEVQKVLPEMVSEGEDGYLRYNPSGFEAILTSAIQEQQDQIDNLKSENEQLKALVCLDHPEAEVCKE